MSASPPPGLFVVWAVTAAGLFRAARITEEEWRDAVENRRVQAGGWSPDEEPVYETPTYAALLRVEEDFDFVLGRPRAGAA